MNKSQKSIIIYPFFTVKIAIYDESYNVVSTESIALDLNESIVLSKLCTLIQHSSIYDSEKQISILSFTDLQKELCFLTIRTLKNTIQKLKNKELISIESQRGNKNKYSLTNHTIGAMEGNKKRFKLIPSLAQSLGIKQALFMHQLSYLLKHSKHIKNNEKWIYKTYDEWLEELPFYKKSTLKKTIKQLKVNGLIQVGEFNKMNTDRTNWYSLTRKGIHLLNQ